mmetsp:Transcript_2255/g.3529  ORF Transcript_2255/g.3529 Transcript_2255/m.3529 type:complete len:163 (-) Transcript_2255:115-603(-)
MTFGDPPAPPEAAAGDESSELVGEPAAASPAELDTTSPGAGLRERPVRDSGLPMQPRETRLAPPQLLLPPRLVEGGLEAAALTGPGRICCWGFPFGARRVAKGTPTRQSSGERITAAMFEIMLYSEGRSPKKRQSSGLLHLSAKLKVSGSGARAEKSHVRLS